MDDLLKDLNDAQKKAVAHAGGPLLIVAGAGTGKTTVLTRRYVHLLQNGRRGDAPLRTDHLLALTFTEKAAGELEDRVLNLLPTGAYDFWISTFHGFCQRVLEAHGLEIGLPNRFRLLTDTDAWLLLKRRIRELPLDHYRPVGNPVRFLRSLLQHISRAKDEGVSPEQYLAFAQNTALDGDAEVISGERKRLQELADVFFAYRRILREEGALDFGDLIVETLRLFRERPAVLDAYRKQFAYLMVDEFQDTNWAQYELLKRLAGSARNLTVVGDDDQSIYKFRGASLANILQFRDDFPDAVTVALTENYRSKCEILDVAYGFIKKNDPNRLEVRLKDTGLTKSLTAARGGGGRIEVIWKRSVEDEADAVAEKLRDLKAREPETIWNDFAILVRSNDGAEPFVRACERAGIPFQFLALRGLYGKPVVLDLLAMLSLLDGYRESTAVWRALNMSCYNLPRRDLSELTQEAERKRGRTLWSALKAESQKLEGGSILSADGLKIARRLVADVEGLAEASRREPPLKILQKTLDKTGYLAMVLRMPEREKREAIMHLNGLADRIKRYEAATHGATVRGFLEEFKLEIESGEEGALANDPEASGPDMVRIMTAHAAKGLEFKHVFLASLVDQRFPTRARGEAIPLPDGLVNERLSEGDRHLEEERRLFYVALTRAKDSLTLSGAARYGGTREKKPSVFLAEAGLDVPPITSDAETDAKRLMSPKEMAVETAADLQHFPLKRAFSFTQLAAFRSCPLQYKFAHIYRIPILGNLHKSFGNSLHNAFQQIMELHLMRGRSAQVSLFAAETGGFLTDGGFRVNQEEALKMFEACWQDEWYESEERHDEFKQLGRKAVHWLWETCARRAPDVLEVEKAFLLKLGQHSITGKIDRVDRRPDGKIAVYDYKTGQMKDSLDTPAKEQLYLYQLALEEKGLLVGKLAYIYVLDGVEREVAPLEGEEKDAFREKILDRMEAILRSGFTPTPEAFTCKSCDFRNICEFRKL